MRVSSSQLPVFALFQVADKEALVAALRERTETLESDKVAVESARAEARAAATRSEERVAAVSYLMWNSTSHIHPPQAKPHPNPTLIVLLTALVGRKAPVSVPHHGVQSAAVQRGPSRSATPAAALAASRGARSRYRSPLRHPLSWRGSECSAGPNL